MKTETEKEKVRGVVKIDESEFEICIEGGLHLLSVHAVCAGFSEEVGRRPFQGNGEKRKMKIQAKLGYGDRVPSPYIPGRATPIFDTKLVAVNGKPSGGGSATNSDGEL